MHSSAVRDLARFGYSRFDVSLDRRLTYRKYSRRLLPREFFPEEMEYLIEEEFLGGGNSRGTPFLGLLNLRGSFLQFSEDTVSPGETARDANEVTVEFSSLRFSNCRCSKQNHWERGILIEIDKKISDPPRWKIYAEYLSKYSICRNSIGIAKRVGEISLRSASN